MGALDEGIEQIEAATESLDELIRITQRPYFELGGDERDISDSFEETQPRLAVLAILKRRLPDVDFAWSESDPLWVRAAGERIRLPSDKNLADQAEAGFHPIGAYAMMLEHRIRDIIDEE
jgi:hypothetical protein